MEHIEHIVAATMSRDKVNSGFVASVHREDIVNSARSTPSLPMHITVQMGTLSLLCISGPLMKLMRYISARVLAVSYAR
jgi:hypothetical protein